MHVLTRVTDRVDCLGCVCVCPPDSKIKYSMFYVYLCSCIFILCYFTCIFYAVVRQISMLIIDNEDCVFCMLYSDLIIYNAYPGAGRAAIRNGSGLWRDVQMVEGVTYVVTLRAKLQALVYDILPSTTAVFSYAIGSRKLSANEQFFCWCSNNSKFVTNNSNKIKSRVIYSHQQNLHQHK